MSRIRRIGVTGPTGAGKGVVCSIFARDRRIAFIDGDKVSRMVTKANSPCLMELSEAFGADIVGPDGELIRKRLAEKAFKDEESTALLNSITHRYIHEMEEEIIDGLPEETQAVLLDGAAIIEGGHAHELDALIAVVAPPEIRLERVIERDGITYEQAEIRMNAQKPEHFYEDHADFVIFNDGSIEDIEDQCAVILPLILAFEE